MNILNRNNWEIYTKITIYSDPNNQNNDYAVINYEVYKPNEIVKEYSKIVPHYLINQAINEFEFQKRAKLIPGKEIEIKNLIMEKEKNNYKNSKKKSKRIIIITSIGVAIALIGLSGYHLIKNQLFDKKNTITYEEKSNNYEEELRPLYKNFYFRNIGSVEDNYVEYRQNKEKIANGNYDESIIDNYINNVNGLIDGGLFFKIEGFNGYHFSQYTIDGHSHIEEDLSYHELFHDNVEEDNKREYMKEQCRYLFYEYDNNLNDIKIRNTNPITISDNKKIYYIEDNDEIDNNYLLSQLTSLIELRKYVIDTNYTYIDNNEKGVASVYAYNDEIVKEIDTKIEQIKGILKVRSINKTI